MTSRYPSRLIMAVVAAIMLVLPVLQTVSVTLAAVPRNDGYAELNALLGGTAASDVFSLGRAADGTLNSVNAGPLAAEPGTQCLGTVGVDQVCITKTLVSPVG